MTDEPDVAVRSWSDDPNDMLPRQLVDPGRRLENIAESCETAEEFFAAALAGLTPIGDVFDSREAMERSRVAAKAVTRYGVEFVAAWQAVGGDAIDRLRFGVARRFEPAAGRTDLSGGPEAAT